MSKLRFHVMVLTAFVCVFLAVPAAAESQARIVRLSDVQGGVQIDKNAGLGFENAFLNLPITQGTQLRTRANGRAEIEFEDGSTLRVTPNTTLAFSTLGLSDEGKRLSTVNLTEGGAYVNWLGKGADKFTLIFSEEKVELTQPAHFRVAVSSDAAQIASFKNDLVVIAPTGTVKVDKKKMVSFDLNDNDRSSVAKYFAGVGWNPFMDGAWSWYPGMGYMWASAYPWGWMPYYYGNWVYAPGFGWGWQPGGFNSWHGGVHYLGAAAGFQAPVAPKGTVSTVVVGKGGPTVTRTLATSLVLNRGSAGIGIPRGSLDNLHHLNGQVAKTGSVELHAAPQFLATSSRQGGYSYGEGHAASSSSGMGHASAPSAGHASSAGGAGHR